MRRKILQFNRGVLEQGEEEFEEKDNREERERFKKILSAALSLGGSIVVPIAGGALLGVFLDKIFSTTPFLTLTLLALGVVSAFYTIYRLTQDIS